MSAGTYDVHATLCFYTGHAYMPVCIGIAFALYIYIYLFILYLSALEEHDPHTRTYNIHTIQAVIAYT